MEVRVPTLAYDDTSITLVWDKPEKYDDVANYYVYQDSEKIGDARSNFAENADWAAAYMESFYDYYETEKSSVDMVNVDIHSFKATGLEPDTEYEFEVVAVDDSGAALGGAGSISWSTTGKPEEFNIKDYGAKTVETGYTTYDEEKNAFILANTRAIQAAIDDCSEGGRVVDSERNLDERRDLFKEQHDTGTKKRALCCSVRRMWITMIRTTFSIRIPRTPAPGHW